MPVPSKEKDNAIIIDDKPQLIDGKRTHPITYNVNDRDRVLTGKPRRYDNNSVFQILNSKLVQEKIQHRDCFGYYGHWPRYEFGMDPSEGGVIDGKIVIPEAGLVVTQISADREGNVTFAVEFMETPMGRVAKRMYLSKKGGFSIAWQFYRPYPGAPLQIIQFYGMDYVKSPNYSRNRGYVMDGANAEDMECFAMDSAEGAVMLDGIEAMAAQNERLVDELDIALETIARQSGVIDDLTTIAARGGEAYRKAAIGIVTDSVDGRGVISMVPKGTSTDLAHADDFLGANLERLAGLDGDNQAQQSGPIVSRVIQSLLK